MTDHESQKIASILCSLTLAEKVQLCHAGTKFSVKGIPEKGVPDIMMSDGPHGVRREISLDSWEPVDTDKDFATYLPTGTALAATWNAELGLLHGSVLGSESRERGKDFILGPGFNIIRSPLCGRNFEYYTEDPFLNSSMVKPAIEGIQAQGTAACAKHYACNSQELNRHGVNALPPERALREIYLPAFKAAVDAGVLTVMGAYNKFRGQWCCENATLLNQILKDEWGFEGLVVSDWAGVHNTREAAHGGMDIEMGTSEDYVNGYHLGPDFLAALESGEIEESVVDDKVRRILLVLLRIGALEPKGRPTGERNTKAHQQAALQIAREAITLLKNETSVLPLDSTKLKKLLVVGNNATAKHHLGGASSAVKALYEITPLEGIRNHLGESVDVEYLPDPQTDDGTPIPTEIMTVADAGAGVNGWRIEFCELGKRDVVLHTAARNDLDLDWHDGPPKGIPAGLRWQAHAYGTITVPTAGLYTFVINGAHDGGINLDGNPFLMRFENEDEPKRNSARIDLRAGQVIEIEVQIAPHKIRSSKHVSLRWQTPGSHSGSNAEHILEQARAADAVIYVGGLSHSEDTEGKDKSGIDLPGDQDSLISQLAAANTNFAAVMVSGSPYAMPWIDQVPAIVQLWYAGMEAGTALADVLFGKVNPSGKLPFTFPVKLNDSAAHALDDYDQGVCYYKEGIFVGYRWHDLKEIAPLFPFGHGLSYTQFSYGNLQVSPANDGGQDVAFDLTNSGDRAGSEVAQVYVGLPDTEAAQPVRQLKGFQTVALAPGATTSVRIHLSADSLRYFHPTRRRWEADKGTHRIEVGSSSRDLRLAAHINR